MIISRVYSAADLYNLLAMELLVGMISQDVGFYDVLDHGSERFLKLIRNESLQSFIIYGEKTPNDFHWDDTVFQ